MEKLTTIATLSAQIGEAERELHELQTEQLQSPERIRHAALAGDVETQVSLQKRLADLPMWISARARNVERLHVERYELMIEEAKAEEEKLLPDIEPADARAVEAIKERARVRGIYHDAHARTKDLELDKREHTRRLQALGGETTTRVQHLAPAA
jgi:chromosome segregation ATPase